MDSYIYKARFFFIAFLVSIPLTLTMGVYFLLGGKLILGSVILIFCLSSIYWTIQIYRRPKTLYKLNIFIAAAVFATSAASLLTNFGDIGSTLWFATHPMCLFFILGYKRGVRWNIALFSVFFIAYYFDPLNSSAASIDPSVIANVVGASLFATFLSGFFSLQMEKNRRQLEIFANFDALTKIHNRRYLNDILLERTSHNRRSGDLPSFSLVMLDIDNFKNINDTWGHDTGDLILHKMAAIIEANIRKEDIVARWGGEEFLIYLEGATVEDAYRIAEHLRSLIQDAYFSDEFQVTSSFGVAQFHRGVNLKSLIRRADAMMYYSKYKGKNISSFCSSKDPATDCSNCSEEKIQYCSHFGCLVA